MSGTSNTDNVTPEPAASPDPVDAPTPDRVHAEASAQSHAQATASSGELAAATARVTELERQVQDLTDRMLRAHAEMDNLRKRAEREKTETAKYAISKFAADIVGVADNFQRAVTSVPPGQAEEDPVKSLVEGLLMTERAFVQALERHGVKRIDPQGEAFNPHLHQAVMEQQNPAVPAGTILSVFQAGYVIEDRVLRPAMVMVAKGGAKPPKIGDTGQPADAEPGAADG
jgi:molecular chaperone GrpE